MVNFLFYVNFNWKGYVRVIVKGKVVKEYGRGDYFGELVLINDEFRVVTVVVIIRCKCVFIDLVSFKVKNLSEYIY